MAGENLASFNRKVERFARSLPMTHLVPFQKKIALEALKRIVMKTPVDTGRARGNWQVTINEPAEGYDENETSKRGSGAINRGMAQMEGLLPFQTVWITNNLPYIQELENGTSSQAPGGMVAETLAELETMFG